MRGMVAAWAALWAGTSLLLGESAVWAEWPCARGAPLQEELQAFLGNSFNRWREDIPISNAAINDQGYVVLTQCAEMHLTNVKPSGLNSATGADREALACFALMKGGDVLGIYRNRFAFGLDVDLQSRTFPGIFPDYFKEATGGVGLQRKLKISHPCPITAERLPRGFSTMTSGCDGCLHVAGLFGGSFLRASYEPDRGTPEHQGYNGKKPLSRLDSKDGDFRSVLAAASCLIFATWVYLRGWDIFGWLCAAYAIFGLMFRVDPWSLAVRIL